MLGESEILGLEVVGVVFEVVSDVSIFKEGDRVCGLVVGGGYVMEVLVNFVYLMCIL